MQCDAVRCNAGLIWHAMDRFRPAETTLPFTARSNASMSEGRSKEEEEESSLSGEVPGDRKGQHFGMVEKYRAVDSLEQCTAASIYSLPATGRETNLDLETGKPRRNRACSSHG